MTAHPRRVMDPLDRNGEPCECDWDWVIFGITFVALVVFVIYAIGIAIVTRG